jgi:hypothetical protein
MNAETKFREMAIAADAAIRDFNDFADDQAVWWAWEKIGSLRDTLQAIATIANDYIPDNDSQAPLALSEMREALQSLLANASVSITGGEPGYAPRECSADCFGYDDEMHGWVVYAQPTRGEYTIIAGPFVTDNEARNYFEMRA